MSTPRVLVIGLDGATFDLIEPWVAAGKLPTLARLMQEGTWGRLQSTQPPHSCPAWTSFATGLYPGRHGIYSFLHRQPGSYTLPTVNQRLIQGVPVWQILSQIGRRVGIVNIPLTYPPIAVNGYMISGLLSPGADEAFYPPDLAREVNAALGPYCVEPPPVADRQRYLDLSQTCAEKRLQVATYLLQHHSVDFFAIVFTLLDRLQHFYWAHMDPQHPCHDPQAPPEFQTAIEDGYKLLDRAVDTILPYAGPETTVFLVSDHGFEGVFKMFYPNYWLREQGLLVLQLRRWGKLLDRGKNLIVRLGLQDAARKIKHRVPAMTDVGSTGLSYATDVDWQRTQAVFGPNLGINLNVRGRDPQGIVEPGAEYEQLRDRLIRDMLTIRDPQTNDPVIQAVYRREEIYEGTAVELAPDLRVEMAHSQVYPGQYAYSPQLDSGALLLYPDKVMGNHASQGILIASGYGIRRGARVEGAQIADMAPTMLYAMDAPLPCTMDGRLLADVYDPSYRTAHPEQYDEGQPEHPTPRFLDAPASETEDATIRERLRGLGYLD
jgi:predicted AlkP superfamily phosphohydrolase/phosphomutase